MTLELVGVHGFAIQTQLAHAMPADLMFAGAWTPTALKAG